MNSFTLKMIACIAMLIDHIGAIFIPSDTGLYMIFRIIGRIAFPIFCFLLVEGFFHTSNIKKYLMRLGIFAVISEFAFDFAFYNKLLYFESQNVFFTLFIGLLVVYVYNLIVMKYREQPVMMTTLAVITILSGSSIAFLLKTDYSYMGIILIVCMYIYHYNKVKLAIGLGLLMAVLFVGLQWFAAVAIIFMLFYNGERGPKVKFAFYAFYPVHLVILGIIAHLM